MCHCLPCQIFDIIQSCWTQQCSGKARERHVPSTWRLVPLVLCERNKTCGGGGRHIRIYRPSTLILSVHKSYLCLPSLLCQGILKGKPTTLFFLWSPVLPALAPAGASGLSPDPKMGNQAGGSMPRGSCDGCGQVPGTCISPPAASRASSFLSCPPSEGSSIRRAQCGGPGERPEPLRVSGTPPHPARRGSRHGAAS